MNGDTLPPAVQKIVDRQETVNLDDGGFLVENYDVRIAGIESELAWRPVCGAISGWQRWPARRFAKG